jgi:hypothetical protein
MVGGHTCLQLAFQSAVNQTKISSKWLHICIPIRNVDGVYMKDNWYITLMCLARAIEQENVPISTLRLTGNLTAVITSHICRAVNIFSVMFSVSRNLRICGCSPWFRTYAPVTCIVKAPQGKNWTNTTNGRISMQTLLSCSHFINRYKYIIAKKCWFFQI